MPTQCLGSAVDDAIATIIEVDDDTSLLITFAHQGNRQRAVAFIVDRIASLTQADGGLV